MELIFILMDSTLQDLSNDTKKAQFGIQIRKLWPQEVHNKGEMNSACRGITVHMPRHRGPYFTNFLFSDHFRAYFPRHYKYMFLDVFRASFKGVEHPP